MELIQNALSFEEQANYFPHYARQPVLAHIGARDAPVAQWSLNKLKKLRDNALKSINNPEDILAKSLSPIFIACLDTAIHPEDILENAIKIRNTKEASKYRKEVEKALSSTFDQMEYKINLDALMSLDEIINAKKENLEYYRKWTISLPKTIPLGYTCAGKSTYPRTNKVGDRTAMFFSDVLRQSLGTLNSSEKLSKIFNNEFKFDTSIISCAVPNFI